MKLFSIFLMITSIKNYVKSVPFDSLREELSPWPKGVIPYEISNISSAKDKRLIINTMEKIQNISCVRFIKSTTRTTYLEIMEQQDQPCRSFIGYKKTGNRTMYLQKDCMHENGLLHEFMHALGFGHEHNRYDRDEYIKILFENIQEKYWKYFRKHNYLKQIYRNMRYDFSSVMHFPKYNNFAINNSLPTIEGTGTDLIKASGLSNLDIKKINLYYRCDVEKNEIMETPLHRAAINGEEGKVLYLLANNANVYEENQFGDTPIHIAASAGKTIIVQIFLDYNVTLVNEKNNYKYTPLHSASANGHSDTVLVLLNKGAKINDKANYKNDPLETEPSVTPLHLAAENGNVETVRILVNNSADMNAMDKDGNTPIHTAAFEGRTAVVNVLLEYKLELLTSRNYLKHTPLHKAAMNGHFETVLALIRKGININDKANHKNDPISTEPSFTALHLAAENGNVETVRILVNNSADMNAMDKDGNTPIHSAAFEGRTAVINVLLEYKLELLTSRNYLKHTPLHKAAMNGHFETVLALIRKGINIDDKANYKNDPSGTKPSITALHLAAENGNVETVRVLLNNKADVNVKEKDGNTPIHFAAAEGNTAVANLMLEYKADLIKLTNHFKCTPLHMAANKGHPRTVLALLLKGANINDKANNKNDPLGTVPSVTALHLAAENGKVETVRLLITNDADVNAMDNNGDTPIHYAVAEGNIAVVSFLLEYNASLVYKRNYLNYTPLHIAANQARSDMVSILIKKGAIVNAKANYKNDPNDTEPSVTALHLAAENGNFKAVRVLFDSNADVTAKDKNGNTPIHLAACGGKTEVVLFLLKRKPNLAKIKNNFNFTILHMAASNGHPYTTLRLLNKGLNVNEKSNYKIDPGTEPSVTALHLAAENGNVETVGVLINNKADMGARDNAGNTPIHLAAYEGHTAVVNILLEHNPNLVNAVNNHKNTPLHYATWAGHEETVLALLKKGADVNMRNDMNDTALDLAQRFNNRFISLLLEFPHRTRPT